MRYDETLFTKVTSPLIPQDAQVIFVADAFADQLLGGAELTLQALIDTSPYTVHKLRCSELTIEHLKQGSSKYWIFGNYASLNPQLIGTIASNMRYSIVECDYKFCRYRSVEKHLAQAGVECDCASTQVGTLIASLMAAADHVFWMSEKQRDAYHSKFPFLADYQQQVLSSVFDDKFFARVEELRAKHTQKNGKWLVLNHPSWIKGTDAAKAVAEEKKLDYVVVGNIPYDRMLEELAQAEGLIFTPAGGDTCPRLVIEAKLLGCKLYLNDNVQHMSEAWFDTTDLETTEAYLRAAPAMFWHSIKRHMQRDYLLSGYATTYNCEKQGYPYVASIESLLGFCSEVVVVDAGSTDGTLAALGALQVKYGDGYATPFSSHHAALADMNKHSKLKVYIVERDWTDPRSALFDGMQKAEARRRCTGDFVWQQDVDEVVRKEDWGKVLEMVKSFPKAVPMIALPVVEYWGGFDKVRLDVTPWKWRLSRNSPRITHGVPAAFRGIDSEGRMYAKPGTDGCDPIDANSGEPIVFLGFLSNEHEQLRQQALQGNSASLASYEEWFLTVVQNVPAVYHASWLDIERKIRLYRDFWTRHWTVLEGKEYKDTAASNMFFDKPWAEVTDADISQRAKELAEGTGGHIFHAKWTGQRTPWMSLARVNPPAELQTIYGSR